MIFLDLIVEIAIIYSANANTVELSDLSIAEDQKGLIVAAKTMDGKITMNLLMKYKTRYRLQNPIGSGNDRQPTKG